MDRQRNTSIWDALSPTGGMGSIDFLQRLEGLPPELPQALLHSGRPHPRWATHSLLAQPRAWFVHTADGNSRLTGDCPAVPLTDNLWQNLRLLLNNADLPGRWVGYFSYDLCRLIESGKLPDHRTKPGWPLVELAYCPTCQEIPTALDPPRIEPPADPFVPMQRPVSNLSRAQYLRAAERVLGYIAAGDVFQVNLAQTFRTIYHGSVRNLYRRLAQVSPAWYGAMLELPAVAALGLPARALLSTSPELFLRMQGGRITTRPIKGTRPNRDPLNPQQDAGYRELLHSEKEAAELHMIVDLMRNDLGRVCSYGSVRVVEPRVIESHPTVHHGVATIEGTLHESRDVVDLLRAMLPGGSVTGAPKVRAMQIIDELEPDPRGPYCGCIGTISRDSVHLNIAIRTMLLTQQRQANEWRVEFSVGGGIVADSDPEMEYQETLDKARAMMNALGGMDSNEKAIG